MIRTPLRGNQATLGKSEERFHGILLSIYKKVVDGEAAKKVFDMEAGDKKQKEKEKFLEQVANKSPLKFFNEAIDQRLTLLSMKGKGKGKASPDNASLPSAELTLAALHSSTGTLDKQEVQNIIADCPNHELSRPKPKSKAGARAASGKAKARAQRNRRAKAKTKAVTSLRGKAKVAKAQASRVASQKTGCPPSAEGGQRYKQGRWRKKTITKDGPLASRPEDGNDEPKALQLVLEFGGGDAFVGILPTFAVCPFCP